jgi:predicted nucleic acid-binding protein
MRRAIYWIPHPLAALLLARPAAVDLISPWLNHHEMATIILAYAEVVEYSKDFSGAKRRQSQLRTLLGEVYPYFLTYPILERYTDIRRSLRRPQGKGLIGDIDTLIAATALERNLTVVTIASDFQRVPNLKVILLSPSSMKVLSTP